MEYKVNLFYANGKDMALVMDLTKAEFDKFLANAARGVPHWNKDEKGGFAIPLHNVMYYTFGEYTDEMKKADKARMEAFEKQAQAAKKIEEKKEEKKDINAA